jgi:hypothetical protein
LASLSFDKLTQPPTTCAITTTPATVLRPIWLHLKSWFEPPTYFDCFRPRCILDTILPSMISTITHPSVCDTMTQKADGVRRVGSTRDSTGCLVHFFERRFDLNGCQRVPRHHHGFCGLTRESCQKQTSVFPQQTTSVGHEPLRKQSPQSPKLMNTILMD